MINLHNCVKEAVYFQLIVDSDPKRMGGVQGGKLDHTFL